jgi:NADPH:quinone reductase-like Zn-dependent oxidoreductase
MLDIRLRVDLSLTKGITSIATTCSILFYPNLEVKPLILLKTKFKMKAVVLTQIGPARSSFKVEDRAIPQPAAGQVLIRIKAFGLNHSELSTRLGEPNPIGPVSLPRVLGIECVGVVESAPGAEDDYPAGAVVMAALGGLGRMFDGSYAEFCLAPKGFVIRIADSEAELQISWEILGALPEMLQTAHGCLFRSLRIAKGEKLLVRGATSSVGLAAIRLAKHASAQVVATTRNAANEILLKNAGADDVLVDKEAKLHDIVRQQYQTGFDKILDLVGAATAPDSLRCLAFGGICCSAGTLGGKWTIDNFIPNLMLPVGRYLTSYGEMAFKKENAPWDELLELVRTRQLMINLGQVFRGVESVVEAHELMESNAAGGKLVVVV